MKNLKSISFQLITILFLAAPFIMTSCDDDDGMGNPQELITTVKLTFTAAGGSAVDFSVKDLDGDGGNPPVADTIVLKPSTAYTISVKFLDEQDPSHTHDITDEVKDENTDHLVCYETTGAMPVPATTDTDSNGKPLGLAASVTTGAAGTGTLKVSLKHLANKSSATPCTTGDTDAEVTFPVKVQ